MRQAESILRAIERRGPKGFVWAGTDTAHAFKVDKADPTRLTVALCGVYPHPRDMPMSRKRSPSCRSCRRSFLHAPRHEEQT